MSIQMKKKLKKKIEKQQTIAKIVKKNKNKLVLIVFLDKRVSFCYVFFFNDMIAVSRGLKFFLRFLCENRRNSSKKVYTNNFQ